MNRRLFIRLLIIFIIAWSQIIASLSAAAHDDEPHIQLNTTHAQPGMAVDVRGAGFAPDDSIIIMLLGADHPVSLGAVNADEEGNFTQVVSLPVDLLPGAHEVRASDSHHSASAPLLIVPATSSEEGEQRDKSEPLLAPMPTQAADTGHSTAAPTANMTALLPTAEVEPPIPIGLLFSSALAIFILVVGLVTISRRTR